VVYELTALGQNLHPVLESMNDSRVQDIAAEFSIVNEILVGHRNSAPVRLALVDLHKGQVGASPEA
jgi:hypothetical protein